MVWLSVDCAREVDRSFIGAPRTHRRRRGKARADISAAEARSAEYEQRIRDIKIAIYKTKELRRRQQLEAHTAEVAEARKVADARVQSGREALQAEVAQAEAGLQPNVNSLVNQIIQTVLKSASESTVAGR